MRMRRKFVLVPDVPKQSVIDLLVIGFSETGLLMTDLSETGLLVTDLSETGLLVTDLSEIDLSAIGSLKADLSNLNGLELIREPEETVDELAFENHEAVERAKRVAVFFQDAAESELVAVLALLCLFQFQAV